VYNCLQKPLHISQIGKHHICLASSGFRHQNENPQVVGLGLKVHQATRSKAEVDMLHRFGYCVTVSYERVLRIETQLAAAVLKQAAQINGIYSQIA